MVHLLGINLPRTLQSTHYATFSWHRHKAADAEEVSLKAPYAKCLWTF